MNLTKQQRIAILEVTKEKLQTSYGICYCITVGYEEAMGIYISPGPNVIHDHFPEFLKFKPRNKKRHGGFWWNVNRRRKRIRVVNKVIKEIQDGV